MLGRLSKWQALVARQSIEVCSGVHFHKIRKEIILAHCLDVVTLWTFFSYQKKRNKTWCTFFTYLLKRPKSSRGGCQITYFAKLFGYQRIWNLPLHFHNYCFLLKLLGSNFQTFSYFVKNVHFATTYEKCSENDFFSHFVKNVQFKYYSWTA